MNQFELTDLDGYNVSQPITVLVSTAPVEKDGKTSSTIKMEAVLGSKSVVTQTPEYMGEAYCLRQLKVDLRLAAAGKTDSKDPDAIKGVKDVAEALKGYVTAKVQDKPVAETQAPPKQPVAQ